MEERLKNLNLQVQKMSAKYNSSLKEEQVAIITKRDVDKHHGDVPMLYERTGRMFTLRPREEILSSLSEAEIEAKKLTDDTGLGNTLSGLSNGEGGISDAVGMDVLEWKGNDRAAANLLVLLLRLFSRFDTLRWFSDRNLLVVLVARLSHSRVR